jgi:hypothetical protein
MNLRHLLIFFILTALATFRLNGQSVITTGIDTHSIVSADSLFSMLEKKYKIKLYCPNDLESVRKLPHSLSALPLEEALSELKKIMQCTYVIVDSTSYILMPLEKSDNFQTRDEGFLLIGNPNEYGKYKTATLTGTVLDGKTDEPLAGAVVSIKRLNTAIITDKKGKFSIKMPVGEYDLELSYFNYNHTYQKIKLVSDGIASFNLVEKLYALDEVIIRGEKAGSNLSRSQMSITRLDLKSIKELPLSMGEKDIIRSMSTLPGIQSTGEFGSGFSVRGGSTDQNLILLEDAPLFNSSHLFGLESVINPDGISGLTLIKAGIPVQYGERASSIMNISMGNNPPELKVKGGIGLLSSRLNIETPVIKEKVYMLIGSRSSYSNWLLHKIPEADLMNSQASFYDLNALLNIRINPKNRISFFAYLSSDEFTYNKTNHYKYGSKLGTFRWSHTFNDKLSSKLLSSYSLYNYSFADYDNLLPADAYRISSSMHYNSLKYNLSWLTGEHISFDFGLNGILYKSQPGDKKAFGSKSSVDPVIIDKEKGVEMAAYFSGNINIIKNLVGELGIRYSAFSLLGPGTIYTYTDYQSRSVNTIKDTIRYGMNRLIKYYAGLEPRFSFRYTLNAYSSVKLSYNRINQYINLISNTSVAIPSDVWKLSSPGIRPLIADQLAIGYYRNFSHNSIETSLEVYYKTLKNIVEYKNGAQLLLNRNIETDLLQANGYNYGVELFVKKNTGRLTGWISYTWSRSLRHTYSPVKDDQINKNSYFPSNYDKPDNLNIIADYNLTRRWHFSASFCYNTGRPVTLPENKFQFGNDWLVIYSSRNKYRLPDYHRLDLSVTCDESLRLKKKWKGSWTLSVINVYGRKNAYSTYYKKEEPGPSNNYRSYSLYTLYIIGRPLPTLTYNYTF